MPRGRLDKELKRKVLLKGGELFEALGIELSEDQRAAVEQAQRQEEKNVQIMKEASKRWKKEHRDEINARARAYRAAHPEKYAEYYRRTLEKHREAILARIKAYYAREDIKERRRERYAAHREEYKAKVREWQAKHREEINARRRAVYAARREEINARRRAAYAMRRAAQRAAEEAQKPHDDV